LKHKRSTDAIVALAKKKSEKTVQQVEQAIKQLIKKNERINFNTVAVESGVSKSYLYNHPDFRRRIESLRKQWQQSPGTVKRQMSDESKDAMIQLLRERIKELEGENKRLKGENKRLYGKIYEKV
jgi:exonuclease VII small subunit